MLVIGDRRFDCRMLFHERGGLVPGETATVPIKFLDPDNAVPFFFLGADFDVWELGKIGEGKVISVSSQLDKEGGA